MTTDSTDSARPADSARSNCYDFPRFVVHLRGEKCPRHTGGDCNPLKMPVPPYTEEEAAAVQSYIEVCDYFDGKPSGITNIKRFTAPGTTGGQKRNVGPCPCECNSGGFCGGCGHAGCSGGVNLT